jgi:hypothetical protein
VGYAIAVMPVGLQQKRLKVEFYMTSPAITLGQWSLSIWNASNVRVPLTTDANGSTVLPSGYSGKFTAVFNADSSASYSVRFTQTNNVAANTLYLTNLIVGPGIQPQGAVVGPWQSFTPTLGTNAPTFTPLIAQYREVGDSMEMEVRLDCTANGTDANLLIMNLPNGLHATGPDVGTSYALGTGFFSDGASFHAMQVVSASANGVLFSRTDNVPGSSLRNNDFGVNEGLHFRATIPIAEWAGRGVNLVEESVEYAFNTGNVITAGGSDTTSFGYGPQGTPILAYDSTTPGQSTHFTVQFQHPIQPTDSLTLEVNYAGSNTWMSFEDQGISNLDTYTSQYGGGLSLDAQPNQVVVNFGNMGYDAAGSTYASAGGPWSTLAAANYRWRVKKTAQGQAVGFSIPTFSNSSGGEINAVLNPSASLDTLGWLGAAGYTVARSSNSPLSPAVPTTLAFSAGGAGGESSTSGAYYTIGTIPPALQGRKLKIEFYMQTPPASQGTWAFSLYNSANVRVPLTTDSGGATYLPSGVNGKFTAYFFADTAPGYSLRFTQTALTSANTLYVTNVVVGPEVYPQGAVVGPWQSFTPTWVIDGTAPVFNINSGFYRQVGSNIELRVEATVVTGGSGGTSSNIVLPNGWHLDLAAVNDTVANSKLGTAYAYQIPTAGQFSYDMPVAAVGYTNIAIFKPGTTASLAASDMITGSWMVLEASIPIAELARSATVNIGEAQVEYAANNGSAVGADDYSSFVYGPNGTPFISFTPGDGFTYHRQVQFNTPILPTDSIFLEVSSGNGSGPWLKLTGNDVSGLQPFTYQNGNIYGASVVSVGYGTNYARVDFGGYAYSQAGYGASGVPWSSYTSFRWRVKKVGSAEVGIPSATPTQAGLVTSYAPRVQAAVIGRNSSYMILDNDGLSYLAFDTSAGNYNCFLPDATLNPGRVITIKKGDTVANGYVTVLAQGVQTIDGVAALNIISSWDAITVISDGANWRTIGFNYGTLKSDSFGRLRSSSGIDFGPYTLNNGDHVTIAHSNNDFLGIGTGVMHLTLTARAGFDGEVATFAIFAHQAGSCVITNITNNHLAAGIAGGFQGQVGGVPAGGCLAVVVDSFGSYWSIVLTNNSGLAVALGYRLSANSG